MKIAVVGTGEMGTAVGARLREARLAVADDDDALLDGAAFVLSIVPPGVAVAVAQRLAPALARLPQPPVYVDCNAIAPATAERIAATVSAAGAAFADGGIVGGPPRGDDAGPAFYVSGPAAARCRELERYGVRIRVLDGPAGVASSLKMCYGGITKGVAAIGAAMLRTAERHGLDAALRAEFAESDPVLFGALERRTPQIARKASRWVDEMDEIAAFCEDDPEIATLYAAIARFYAAAAATRTA